MVLRWASLELRQLSRLDLFLGQSILANLSILQLLGELLLFGLLLRSLALLFALEDTKDLISVILGFENSIFIKLFFFDLSLVQFLQVLLVFGHQRLLLALALLGSLS